MELTTNFGMIGGAVALLVAFLVVGVLVKSRSGKNRYSPETVEQLAEFSHRLRSIAQYLVDGKVHVAREIYKGTFNWSGAAAQQARYSGVGMESLYNILCVTGGTQPLVEGVSALLNQVVKELNNVQMQRYNNFDDSHVTNFNSSQNQRLYLSGALCSVAGNIEQVIQQGR